MPAITNAVMGAQRDRASENLSWQTLALGHCIYNEIEECREHKLTTYFFFRYVTFSWLRAEIIVQKGTGC